MAKNGILDSDYFKKLSDLGRVEALSGIYRPPMPMQLDDFLDQEIESLHEVNHVRSVRKTRQKDDRAEK